MGSKANSIHVRPEVRVKADGEVVMPFYVFQGLPAHNIDKTLKQRARSRQERKNASRKTPRLF